MLAIFKREFRSYFTSPLGYVFAAIILFFEGLAFSLTYSYSGTDLTTVFGTFPMVLAVMVPVLTMRILSEDRKLKVDQALLTAPIGVGGIVMGKFLAAFAVYVIPFAPTLLFQIIISSKIETNWLLYLNCILGVVLIGAALISIGMFISSLTESSVISCILTLTIFLVLTLVTSLASLVSSTVITAVAEYFAVFEKYEGFIGTVFSVENVVYMLSISGVFCFLTVRAVERRRWA